jgi:hypothetical protein
MSTDYSARLGIGFVFKTNDINDKFWEEVPEKSHMEDRFDPKTGKKMAPVKVVDQERGSVLKFHGKTYEDIDVLVSAIAKMARCSYDMFGYEQEEGFVSFCLRFKPRKNYAIDFGNISMGGELYLSEVLKMGPKLAEIRQRLISMGLKPKQAEVFVAHSVG